MKIRYASYEWSDEDIKEMTRERQKRKAACTHKRKQPAHPPALFYCPECGHLELKK